MKLVCHGAPLRGRAPIPGSKSHTIRAVAIAALASGESRIRRPLDSEDARAAVRAYTALGARIDTRDDVWTVSGTGGRLSAPADIIDVANSGTTLRIAMGSCALLREGQAVLTGDDQIQRRPSGPLAVALTDLGADAQSVRGNGCPPFAVKGTLRGGETSIECNTSQYLTSLLMNCPLADGDSVIRVPLLNEQPYVAVTLDWLELQGVRVNYESYDVFEVPGGQQYLPVDRAIPADFSSATFFLAAGALGDNDVFCEGLDMTDTQGDRAVVDYLRQMGAAVEVEDDGVRVKGKGLEGCELDLNATPDALPMMAVMGCFAKGTTRLVNVPQARVKETDRITVMAQELSKLGARTEELADGLVVHESALHGTDLDGHGDHRVVMALAIAASMLRGPTTIHGYEAVDITFPGFADVLSNLGGQARVS